MNDITDITSKENTLWTSTTGGVYAFNYRDSSLVKYTNVDGTPNTEVLGLDSPLQPLERIKVKPYLDDPVNEESGEEFPNTSDFASMMNDPEEGFLKIIKDRFPVWERPLTGEETEKLTNDVLGMPKERTEGVRQLFEKYQR